MLKKILKKTFNKFGFHIAKKKDNIDYKNEFEIYRYFDADGNFDYESYKEIQIEGNKTKIERVWVLEENISYLSEYIENKIDNVRFGICHGTRRGKEQQWFRKYLNCEVLGTEISDTAEQFPHTIQWDFHEVKPEWTNAVDFIYSNSLDHSYDPSKCLGGWINCLKANGICIIEHSSDHVKSTQLDPFGAELRDMPYLILKWGKGKYFVSEILKGPKTPEGVRHVNYLIIQKTNSQIE